MSQNVLAGQPGTHRKPLTEQEKLRLFGEKSLEVTNRLRGLSSPEILDHFKLLNEALDMVIFHADKARRRQIKKG